MHLDRPTPKLPVRDVIEAQFHYRDRLDFEIFWHNETGGIGAVFHGECTLFLRATEGPIHPAVFWVFPTTLMPPTRRCHRAAP